MKLPPYLVLFFASVASSSATLAVTWSLWNSSRTLAGSADALARDAAPSIVLLDLADSELRRLQVNLKDLMHRPNGPDRNAEIERLLARLEQTLDSYFALPTSPGETLLWADIRSGFDEIRFVARQIGMLPSSSSPDMLEALNRRLDVSSSQLDAALLRATAFNADHARRISAEIESVRRHSLWWAGLIEALATAGVSVAVVAGAILVRRTIRESDRTVRMLNARASELEAFSGRVAHDLLSPLTNVSLAFGHAETLAARAADARSQRIIERASNSLQGVRRMVEALLEFARSGARPDPMASVEIAPIVRDVLAEHEELAERSGVAVTVSEVPPLTVACSAGILTSVLSNLLQNAVRYTAAAKDRRVDLRVLEHKDFARVEVRDSGPGIAEEDKFVIFEPHVRRTSVAPAGLGLGLATVKRLVEAHGGSVGVESAAGHGAVFWFTLPLVRSPEEAMRDGPRSLGVASRPDQLH